MPSIAGRGGGGIARSVVEAIGNTPLLRIRDPELPPRVEVYAKLEFFNPGGSVKDRPARRMIEDGVRGGDLVPGKIILDSTSGNTGIAYAMIGAALGYQVRLAMPAVVSRERKAILADAILGHDTALADKFDAEDLIMLLAPLGEERADVRSPLPPDVTRVNP